MADNPPIEKLVPDEDASAAASDVDELSGSNYAPASSEDEDDGFGIIHVLEPPNLKHYTTKELHAMIHLGDIELDPLYQRDIVWPEVKQIGLVDSVFRNFYIPPIVFALHEDEFGNMTKVCVDGKQRLTAIQKFFDGQIPFRDPMAKKNWFYHLPARNKGNRAEVPEKWKRIFSEKKITCMEYNQIGDDAERAVFERVQMGMPLTAAEKLQAIWSPWSRLVGELEAQYVTTGSDDGLAHILRWDTNRARDFQGVAQIVYCCEKLIVAIEDNPTTSKLDKWAHRTDSPSDNFRNEMRNLFSEYLFIASNSTYNHGFIKSQYKVAPVEFIYIGVLLYSIRNATKDAKAQAIVNLRKIIRTRHVDIRTNDKVGKDMWAIINAIKENPNTRNPKVEFPKSTASKRTRKRKVPVGEDSDEEEYIPAKKSTSSRSRKTR